MKQLILRAYKGEKMNFGKTDEQELLIENLRSLLTREAPESYIKECDSKHLFPEKELLLVSAFLDHKQVQITIQ